MKKADFKTGNNKPEIEINKSGEIQFWQRPEFSFWAYVIFMIISLYLWGGYSQALKEEIPYSEFIAYVNKNEVAEAVVTDKSISGTLTLKNEKTNTLRRFITIPLLDNDLAQILEKHGVKYSVRKSSNWLGNFFLNWVISSRIVLFGLELDCSPYGRGGERVS